MKIASKEDEMRSRTDGRNAELGRFLSRPERIYSFSWEVDTVVNTIIDPWTLFLTNPRIVNRISHFAYIKGSLCVRFILNGGPFHFGKLVVSYMPLASTISSNSTTLSHLHPHGTGVDQEMVLATQRPHVGLMPMQSTGACLRLPFMYENDVLSIVSGDMNKLGTLCIRTMNKLNHANNAVEPVTVNVFAWMEDPVLSVPTSQPAYGIVPQTGDEKVGPISTRLTSLSEALEKLEDFPVVGTYATAGATAARMGAGVARVLGYSKVTDTRPTHRFVSDEFHGMSFVDGYDRTSHLTVDSTNEVSISSDIVGGDNGSDLTIPQIASKESFLCTFDWPVSANADAILFSIPVHPMMFARWNGAAQPIVPTALAAAAAPFQYWTGGIRFRFEIVKTQYHKGRLRFIYDPGTLVSTTKFNVNYSKIIDISDASDIHMDVGWASNKPMLKVHTPSFSVTSNLWSTTAAVTPDTSMMNGSLAVVIMNKLTAPADITRNLVQVNVYVSACDDFAVAGPYGHVIHNVVYQPQAGFESLDDDEETFGIVKVPDDLFKIVVGEKIVSFRQLLKRCQAYDAIYVSPPNANKHFVHISRRDMPLYPGVDTRGIHTSSGLGVGVNFVIPSLIHYVMNMYAVYRGGFRWKYINNGGNAYDVVSIRRGVTDSATTVPAYVDFGTTYNASTIAYYTSNSTDYTYYHGYAMVKSSARSMVEAETPYITNLRYVTIADKKVNNAGAFHRLTIDTIGTLNKNVFTSFVSVRDDLSMHFYIGPGLWWSNYLVA